MRRETLIVAAVGVVLCFERSNALTAYYIGNSLTDALNYSAFEQTVASLDAQYAWGRNMIPGAPLDWIWDHPGDCVPGNVGGCYQSALRDTRWDVVTLQPSDRAIHTGDGYGEGDSNMTWKYMNYARARSPEAQFFVYAQWPGRSANFDTEWLKPYTSGATPQSKEFYEKLTRAVQKINLGMKKPLLIPVGHVMYELNQRAKAGRVPGITNINQIYTDDIHLNATGSYIVACTFYACMYRRNPSELGYARYGVSAGLAAAIQDAAWTVVSTNALTGISVAVAGVMSPAHTGTAPATKAVVDMRGRSLMAQPGHSAAGLMVTLTAVGYQRVAIARGN